MGAKIAAPSPAALDASLRQLKIAKPTSLDELATAMGLVLEGEGLHPIYVGLNKCFVAEFLIESEARAAAAIFDRAPSTKQTRVDFDPDCDWVLVVDFVD